MNEVLYRKYRSRTFGEVEGQEVIVQTLKQAFLSDNYSHAYLFAGPRGTGKTTMARLVAKAANCLNFTEIGDVCNECVSCIAVENGSHMDVIEIDAASNRGIEEIRAIKENVNFLPSEGKRKVYIIDEVHMLTREAFNALLKTLEEPPQHVIFVLATTESHKVPITILSRTQRFDFRLATSEQLTSKLKKILKAEKMKADDEVFEQIYRISEGSYRDAESLLGKLMMSLQGEKHISSSILNKVLGIASKDLIAELIAALVTGNGANGLQILDKVTSQGVDLGQFSKQVLNQVREEILNAVNTGQDYSRYLAILSNLVALQNEVRTLDNSQLLLQMLIFKLNSATNTTAPVINKSETPAKAADTEIKPPVKKIEEAISEAPVIKKEKPVEKTSKSAQSAKVSTETGDNFADKWSRLLSEVRKLDFKLWAVLKACRARFEDPELIIETSYAFNVEVLQDESIVGKIGKLLANIFHPGVVLKPVLSNPVPVANTSADSSSQSGGVSNASIVEEIF